MSRNRNENYATTNTSLLAPRRSKAASPSPTKRPWSCRTTSDRTLRWNSASVKPDVDRALIEILQSSNRHIPFKFLCQGWEGLFGKPNTPDQKKVQNRRLHLQRIQREDPNAFDKIVRTAFGLDNDQEQQEETVSDSPTSSTSSPTLILIILHSTHQEKGTIASGKTIGSF